MKKSRKQLKRPKQRKRNNETQSFDSANKEDLRQELLKIKSRQFALDNLPKTKKEEFEHMYWYLTGERLTPQQFDKFYDCYNYVMTNFFKKIKFNKINDLGEFIKEQYYKGYTRH